MDLQKYKHIVCGTRYGQYAANLLEKFFPDWVRSVRTFGLYRYARSIGYTDTPARYAKFVAVSIIWGFGYQGWDRAQAWEFFQNWAAGLRGTGRQANGSAQRGNSRVMSEFQPDGLPREVFLFDQWFSRVLAEHTENFADVRD